jgi:hypothetical protein
VGLTLAQAREQAGELMKMAARGVDVKERLTEERLIAQRQREEQRRLAALEARKGTFGQLLDNYVVNLRSRGKLSWKHVDNAFTRYVRKPFPELMRARACEIRGSDIQAILGRMIQRGITREVNKQRAYLRAAFTYSGIAAGPIMTPGSWPPTGWYSPSRPTPSMSSRSSANTTRPAIGSFRRASCGSFGRRRPGWHPWCVPSCNYACCSADSGWPSSLVYGGATTTRADANCCCATPRAEEESGTIFSL